jgi:hypothetical protein
MKRWSQVMQIRIWGSHSSDRVELYLLGYATWSVESQPTFWRTWHLHLQCRRISQARSQHQAGSKLWRWMWHVLLKWQLIFNGLHSVISFLWQAGNFSHPFPAVFKYHYISTEVLIYFCGVNWDTKLTLIRTMQSSKSTQSTLFL